MNPRFFIISLQNQDNPDDKLAWMPDLQTMPDTKTLSKVINEALKNFEVEVNAKYKMVLEGAKDETKNVMPVNTYNPGSADADTPSKEGV